MFNIEKEVLREKYYVVKGYFIDTEVAAFGFEALTGNIVKVRQLLGNQGVYEPATIEDIMIGF